MREAVGILLYNLGQYDEALRELRTHRRISGSDDYLPLIADAERGRGRAQKALELFAESSEDRLGHDLYTELLMVAAGAHMDLGQVKEARALLETRNFAGNANGTLVRLLSVYSDVIRLQGDADLADRYEELARRTAKATGTLFGDEEVDPNEGVEIVTLTELELPEDLEDDGEESAEDASDDAEAVAGSETTEPSETVTPEPEPEAAATEPAEATEAVAPAQADTSAQTEAADAPEAADQAEAEERLREVDAEFDQETVDELDEILRAAEAEEPEAAEPEAVEPEAVETKKPEAAAEEKPAPEDTAPEESPAEKSPAAEPEAVETPDAPAPESPNRASQDDEENDDDDAADDEELTEPLFDL